MRTVPRVALYAAAVGAVAGAAALAGAAVDPLRDADAMPPAHGEAAGHTPADAAGHAEGAPPGLAVAAAGLVLEPEMTRLPRGTPTEIAFRIRDAEGRPVTRFDMTHERRMHVIVVRRDLTGFQHLHPRMRPDGRWTVPVRLPAAGAYRLYADFRSEGHEHTLAADLAVPGPFAPAALPPARPEAADGPYRVTLRPEGLGDGGAAHLAFAVRREGRAVTDIAPYLGADGHLVALREGDGAFLHVHPEEGDGTPGVIRFGATFPSPGRYRLFLQFRHDGAVRTVAHTVEVPR
jgi:hypothetical protein